MPLMMLTIKKGVYKKLLKLNRRCERFSGLLLKLVRRGRNIDILYELAGSVDWIAKEELLKDIYSRRF